MSSDDSDIFVFLSFAQRLMDKGDRNRPFADSRRHTLEAASADVADREYPGQTRFQEIRGPGERPMRHGQIILRQTLPRFDEPFRVERDAPVEPAGVRNGACHDEDVADVARLYVPGLVVPPANALEMIIPFKGDDFCAQP